jgi:ABC-type multidrug transport system fused ATPase/permease subunit
MGIIGATINFISDFSLLLIMLTGLFIIDPTVSLTTLIIFTVIGISMYLLSNRKSHKLGVEGSRLTIESNESIYEAIYTYREAFVKNRRGYFTKKISNSRRELAKVLADSSFLPNVSKYVLETSIIIAALLISAIQFILKDAPHAIATLSIFLAAGTRIAPAVLRIQQNLLNMKNSLGIADKTLLTIKQLELESILQDSPELPNFTYAGFSPTIIIENLEFQYTNKTDSNFVLKIEKLEINEGESVAIVGPSGSGKSTLVDLILGLVNPNKGKITIGNLSPREAIRRWQGAIAYVPQEVYIANSSIVDNVTLGYESNEVNKEAVLNALKVSELMDFIEELSQGFDSKVGERGQLLSGGQRQRLGIARAVYTKPHLLVMDESTSSLDGATEFAISKNFRNFGSQLTILFIAHRLSTIKDFDKIVYIDKGKIRSVGTFDEVRKEVQEFDHQASLMGL